MDRWTVTCTTEHVEGIEFYLKKSLHSHWIELIFEGGIPERPLLMECIEHSVMSLPRGLFDVYVRGKDWSKQYHMRYNGNSGRLGKRLKEF